MSPLFIFIVYPVKRLQGAWLEPRSAVLHGSIPYCATMLRDQQLFTVHINLHLTTFPGLWRTGRARPAGDLTESTEH